MVPRGAFPSAAAEPMTAHQLDQRFMHAGAGHQPDEGGHQNRKK
jgi:hypothetical protein